MRKTLRFRFGKMIFLTKIKVITEPFFKVIMLALWNSLVDLLNISCPWHIDALGEIDMSSRREWSKKSVQQGRSPFGARSVLSVREYGKRARTPLAAFFNIPLMNEKRIKLHRNVVWNMQTKPLAEYQGKVYGSISYR